MDQKGFTLIELIVIIVILGILAVTAIPKYVDLQKDARDATAEGVLAACRGAATMSFADGLLNPTTHTSLTTAAQLLAAIDIDPATDWEADEAPASALPSICYRPTTAGDCDSGTYLISIATVENATASPPVKAVLSKGAGW